MEKYNYSTLNKLNKDELICIISILERDIRKEYEKFSLPDEKVYTEIFSFFQNNKNINKIPYETAISIAISGAITSVTLDPVTLQLIFTEPDVEFGDVENVEEYNWAVNTFKPNIWDTIVIENIKKVIAINSSGVNTDSRSGSCKVPDTYLRCRMEVSNNRVILKELVELVFRIKGSKSDHWYELYQSITTHLDKEGTLFISVDFDHGS